MYSEEDTTITCTFIINILSRLFGELKWVSTSNKRLRFIQWYISSNCRHAVRRFVQENQGLMRRMYGDERHINVLRAEFEKNDIELKYDDYYHHFADEYRLVFVIKLRK